MSASTYLEVEGAVYSVNITDSFNSLNYVSSIQNYLFEEMRLICDCSYTPWI